jgi:hypothetical protein
MSQSMKSTYYRALQAAGVPLDRHYREYKTEELKAAYDKLVAEAPPGAPLPLVDLPPDPNLVPPHDGDMEELKSQIAGLGAMMVKLAAVVMAPQPVAAAPAPQPAPPPPAPKPNDFDPLEHAGVTMNTHAPDEPVRIDEAGNQWFRNEVNKPGYAKARGRRVLRAMDSGTVMQTIKTKDGYTESFEIPGDPKNARPIEIKVTLPSFQTGIYKAPGMPFKIHTYQGVRGFDWEDVNAYYGAPDLVPSTIKHCYVSSDLCYDIATTIRAIEDEYRERVLKRELTR